MTETSPNIEPAATPSPPVATKRPRSSPVRAEIQALRAVAVLMVVVFHLWPEHLTGGYAGVDVFFVISGFLITGHLLREVERDGRVRLAAFWARRIRRLLPAALLVLLVSAIGVLVFTPTAFWEQFLREIAAAASYVVNWVLAADAVDYLAAENLASPAQHYWSLSVEEQFYVVWPLLVVLGIAIAALFKSQNRRRAITAVLTVVTVASFGYSVFLTATNPAAAYFVTPTRAWEFGIGGLLAIVAARMPSGKTAVRSVVAWAGWAAIAATAFLYTGATPFPGYTALLPVLGAAAVIWAGEPKSAFAPTWIVRLRPIRYLGDISYSLYLWHWPLIVIVGLAIAAPLDTLTTYILFAVSLVLAVLTKTFVEDPGRKIGITRRAATPLAYIGAVAAMAVVLATCGAGLFSVNTAKAEAARQTEALIADATECFGAAAFAGDPCANPDLDGVLVPKLEALQEDGGAYECYDQEPSADLSVCSYGSTKPDALSVALVGDSHAAMILPGINDYLENLNWKLDTYLARGCMWSDPTNVPDTNPCHDRLNAVQDRLETGERYDVVLVTARRNAEPDANPQAASEVFAAAWKPVIDRGTLIIALRDNPTVTAEALTCVTSSGGDYNAAEECGMTRAQAFPTEDPLALAVEASGDGAALIDLSELYCQDNECPMVIGHVIAYRDEHHITAIFSETLAPYLLNGIQKELGSHGS